MNPATTTIDEQIKYIGNGLARVKTHSHIN